MQDKKPEVWVGHVYMNTRELEKSQKFLLDIGMREIFTSDSLGVYELRAGTHLVLRKGEPEFKEGELYFDLMVDDLEKTRTNLVERGLNPSGIVNGKIHDAFMLDEPGGNKIRFNSSHASKFPL